MLAIALALMLHFPYELYNFILTDSFVNPSGLVWSIGGLSLSDLLKPCRI